LAQKQSHSLAVASLGPWLAGTSSKSKEMPGNMRNQARGPDEGTSTRLAQIRSQCGPTLSRARRSSALHRFSSRAVPRLAGPAVSLPRRKSGPHFPCPPFRSGGPVGLAVGRQPQARLGTFSVTQRCLVPRANSGGSDRDTLIICAQFRELGHSVGQEI
jgi:hypothetical protein